MNTCYQHNDSNTRGYHGLQLTEEECSTLLVTLVVDNLTDAEEREAMASDLTGLLQTGFSSANLIADIQALEDASPDDLRDWRIGEAMCQVTLQDNFQCRFHWNERRDARNPHGNKTGADVVGFVETSSGVLFLFGETKTSSETANRPPQVMTSNPEGMEAQLRELYQNALKRSILISYLANKTRGLPDAHPFKVDLKAAYRTYYADIQLYHLIGVLIRDVDPHVNDLSVSYDRLKATILDPIGLKLVALYTTITKENWRFIIEGK